MLSLIKSAFRRAAPRNRSEMIQAVASSGDLDNLQKLLEKWPNDITPEMKDAALLLAAKSAMSDVRIVRCLLAAGASPNPPPGLSGWTPLMYAAQDSRQEILLALLEHGASANYVTEQGGRTALISAAAGGSVEGIQTLLQHNADINLHRKGFTPLAAAVQAGNERTAIFLLGAGADTTIPLHDGTSIREFAETRGMRELAEKISTVQEQRKQEAAQKEADGLHAALRQALEKPLPAAKPLSLKRGMKKPPGP